MKTLEQYEFHLWRLFVYLDPSLASKKNEKGEFLWDHREVFLDTNPEKRAQNRQKRIELKWQSITNVEDINKHDFDSFRLELSKDELSVKTINAHIITYRSWLKFLKKEQVPCLDPTILDLLKPPDREVTFLTSEEIERFFDSIQRETIQGKRDYAISECIYSTGLRISELTALNQKDVNLDTLEFAVRWKWNKVRVVYLTERAKDAIEAYLQARNDNFNPLFIRHNFNEESISLIDLDDSSVRLTRFFITNMIKNYGLKAGIFKNLHAHTLRHSFATTLLTNWADIRIIQELLWHASITTTQVYTHVTNPKLKEAHKKFHN
jgi:site-specific recombinase XerD